MADIKLQKSISNVVNKMKEINRKTLDATKKALLKEAKDLSVDSKKVCPVRTSVLINSLTIRPDISDERNPKVIVGYGAHYAFRVHEMPDSTEFRKSGATNKYLERPFNKRQAGYNRRIAAYIKFFLEKAGL